MPWVETEPMTERMRFVVDAERRLHTMLDLGERYGVTCKWGYKWLDRYEREGPVGLLERPRAPHHCPHRSARPVAQAIVETRPRRLLVWLSERRSELGPAEATPPAGAVEGPGRAAARPLAANDLWTVDFEGHFRTRDGHYRYPLTIAGQYSRYLLGCAALGWVRTAEARPVFERLFRGCIGR